jgi:hypothetical protein
MAAEQAHVWNVSVPAVALVRAQDEQAAIAVVVAALEAAGFTAYENDRDAFESEPVSPESLFEAHECPTLNGRAF